MMQKNAEMEKRLQEQQQQLELQHCKDLLKLMNKIENNDEESLEGLHELQVDDE